MPHDPLVHPAFKHILSIGYEFETHQLSKFRTEETGPSITMVNTFDHPKVADILMEYFDKDGKSNNRTISILDSDDSSLYPHTVFSNLDDELAPIRIGRATAHGYQFITLQQLPKNQHFTGVEWIITYSLIKPSEFTVKRTFLDACRRIAEELHDTITETVDVYPNATSDHRIATSTLRQLTSEPNTYYFHTNQRHQKSLIVSPQMTFRCHVSHARDIIVALVPNPWYQTICNRCDACVALVNQGWPLTPTERGYLFIIVYVLHQYLHFFQKGNQYFKDLNHANPRHTIYDLLKQMNVIKLISAFEDIETQLVHDKFYESGVHWPLHALVRYALDNENKLEFHYGSRTVPSIGKQQKITNSFPIRHDEVFVEAREFELLVPKKQLNVLRGSSWKQVKPSFRDHVLNPTNLKYTKKCRPTKFRDPNDFKCKDHFVPLTRKK